MAKFYAPTVRFKKFLFLFTAFLAISKLNAQTDISIGTGTTGNTGTNFPAPLQDWYEGARAQYLYLASELTGAGMGPGNINAIKFNVTGLNTYSGTIQQMSVRIGTTSVGTLSTAATNWETTTAVFGPVDYVATLGVNTITFTTPYFWNGTGNLVIEICNGLPGNTSDGLLHYTNNVTVPWTSGLPFNGSHTIAVDNGGNLCGSTVTGATITNSPTSRPNITMNWTPAAACTGTPNPGTATASPANVCVDQPITLRSTGVTVASGLSYQWQVSTNGGSVWNDVGGATSITSTATQSVTSQYRFRVVCTRAGGTDTAYSNSVTVTSPPIPVGVYTISKDTITNFPTGRNFNSFNDAYNAIKCGIGGPVIFNVITNATPYNEQLIINGVIPGSSATNTITFNGNGAVIGFTTTNNERAVFKLKNTKHFIFDSLTVNANTGTYGYGFHLLAEADSNTVRRCTINSSVTATTQNYAGIVINGSDAGLTNTGTVLADGNRFSRNVINGGYYGVVIASTFSGGASGNNKIDSNDIREFYAAGVYLAGTYGTVVEANVIHRPTRTAVTNFDGILMTSEKSTGVNITRNRIKNPFGGNPAANLSFNGINFNNSDGSVGSENFVTNNLIYNANGNGAQTGIINTGSDYVYYLHNTIALDYATSTSTSTTRGFYQTSTASGINIYNNVISVTRGGTGIKHAIYLGSGLPADMNYNNYYVNAPGSNNFLGFYTSNRTNLAVWQTATSMDAASSSFNPAFVDPANENYSPGNAALDNKGVYLGVVDVDINNVARSTTAPDIGAYEFTPPPCSVPPVMGTTSLSAVRICEGSPVLLTLNIGAYGSAQTFQWQTSTTVGGPFTSFGSPMLTPDTTILASGTFYYRAAVSCGSSVEYSDPVLLTVDPLLPAGTYTINKGGTPTYVPGVSGGNFISFAAAKDAMSCGIGGPVVFNVVANSGPYNEKLTLTSISGTSATNTITFNGNGNTITANSTLTSDRAVIKLDGADHIIFDSLVVDAGTGTFGHGIQLINDADSNIVRKCTIIAPNTGVSNFAGIVVNASHASAITAGATDCDANIIDSNTVTGGFYGITLVGGTTAATYINNNRITNNTIKDYFSTGLQITGTANTLVEKNIFTRPTIATTATVVYGIYLTTYPSASLQISKNRFTGFFAANPTATATAYGIYHNSIDAAAGGENIVSNNLIHSMGGNGQLFGIYNNGSNNVYYFHNTISLDNTASTAAGQTVGFYQNTAADGIQFINNLINIRRGGNGSKYAVYFGATTSDITADYNNYYVNGGGSNNFTGFYSGNRITLADWKTASGKDANTFAIDPLFINPAAGDYRPGIISLDGKGTNTTGINTDILDVGRSANPDMGAFEFTAPGCVNPPVAGTAVVTPATGACLESRIFMTLTGNSPVGSLTFQWQSSADGTTWTNLSGILYTPDYDTLTTVNRWYRAAVTCNGVTTYSTPMQITLGNILPAGTYTINGGAATNYPGGSNFQTFGEAVDAMLCGVGGKVVFNVAAGTYNEQIRIPYIPGTSSTNTVTFQSANGNASAAILTNASTTSAANYTLKLDSTRNFIFRNLSITATGTTFGRAVDIAGIATNDSIVKCIITAPTVVAASTNIVGIYSVAHKGSNIVLLGNTVNNGAYGIFFTGTGAGNNLTEGHSIDSNTVNGAFNYGIYAGFQKAISLRGNTVNVESPLSALSYGINATDCDSSFVISGNKIRINNTTTTVYGIYVNNSDSSLSARGQILNNIITAAGTNTGTMYGLYINNSQGHNALNNVISLNNTGSISYGLFTNSAVANYWNNSIQTTATSPTNGYAAYIQNSATSNISIRNNIFSNQGAGRAMYVANTTQTSGSDYNMLYAAGATLIQRGAPAGSFANLAAWRTAAFWEMNSIVYQPAFAASTDLQPDLANPDVWAMHGRGVQIAENTLDINNRPRPTTLTTGVPDLGAYEFFPTAQPTVLNPVPATPAPNTTQVFMYGTDTVMKVTWGATAPPDVTGQRFSGVPPAGPKPGNDSMFFYTRLQSSVAGNFPLNMELFYIDPWQGSIPNQHQIGLGRTTAGNSWVVGFNSRVDVRKKSIQETNLSFYDKFTGFVNPYAPPILPDKDSSNRGRRFWVAYPINQLAAGSSQQMVLYLSAQDDANVQVKINGTNWVRNYFVPSNSVTVTEYLPKAGADNAYISLPGTSDRGISIESDVPIVAYAHVIGSTSSGASMLMPVGVWGYEYRALGITQDWGSGGFSYFYVIADNDGTTVEITTPAGVPLQNTGVTPGTPFQVTLNKGQVYQVISSSTTLELSGSIIKSVPNSQGVCYPIASFSGSSRTYNDIPCSGGGDFMMQQNFPSTAWGKRYLTAPSSASTAANNLQTNLYRVAVKDPTTVVKRNGVTLTGMVNNFYYQFTSGTADYIEADKPIMVAQYLSGACTGVGDPEMIYLSPIEQGIDKIGFYRNTEEAITTNYLTLIVPTNGMPSLSIIDGSTAVTPDHTYPHPQNPIAGINYTVVVKRWNSAKQQVRVQSDSAFTAITYGLGSVESYGYNAGTLVRNLNSLGLINNALSATGNPTEFTCVGSPFKFTALLPLIPNTITWKFSAVPGLSPNRDTTINNPVPTGTTVINRTTYYMFPVNLNYTFAGPGVYGVQISYTHPDIESCDHTRNDLIYVQVLPAPKTDFTITPAAVCAGGTVQFAGESTTENGIVLNNWSWTFHNGTTATGQNTSFTYPTAGTYDVRLRTVTPDGCLGDSVKQVLVNPSPTVSLVQNLITVCSGSDTVLRVQNPVTGVTYNWYTVATGGTPVATNQTSLTLTNITAAASYWVEAVSTGCVSAQRTKADINILPQLATPVVTVSSATPNTITFTWQGVAGATYQVSVDNGVTWITPSTGASGTTHVVTGLPPFQEVKLLVRAIGAIACQMSANGEATGRTISSEVYIPNSFSPNGDGLNDRLLVYGNGVKEMQMVVFNQWGEKIFETRNQASGWDGTYKGKAQPSGVYMYVSKITLFDGAVIEKKGAINLIR